LLFLINPVWKLGTMNRATSLFLLVVEGRINEGKHMLCFATRVDGRRNPSGWIYTSIALTLSQREVVDPLAPHVKHFIWWHRLRIRRKRIRSLGSTSTTGGSCD